MKSIGLTGGIASGKTIAAQRLAELGATVIDADVIARETVAAGSEGLKAVAAEFGTDVLEADGSLNRKKLAALVFENDAARARLNGILHPLIRQEMRRRAAEADKAHPGAIVVFDVPLLIECGWHGDVERVWLVTAPMQERIRRIMARDGTTAEEAQLRIAAQMADREKMRYADEVIVNDGSMAQLEEKVTALYDALAEENGKKKKCGCQMDKGGAVGPCGADAAYDNGAVCEPGAGKAQL